MLESILHIVLVLIAFAVIGLVLIQQGKGSDVGASFGAGASQTVFGSSGSGNFLTKATTALGIAFFAICFGLAYWSSHFSKENAKFDFSAAPPTLNVDVPALEKKIQSAATSDIPAVPTQAAPATTASKEREADPAAKTSSEPAKETGKEAGK